MQKLSALLVARLRVNLLKNKVCWFIVYNMYMCIILRDDLFHKKITLYVFPPTHIHVLIFLQASKI